MKIPRIDLKRDYRQYRQEIDQAIKNVIHETAFVGGPFVKEFEEAFARYHELSYCVGVGNGTEALELALKVLGVGEGDEVLVPSFTFYASVEAVVTAGATPVYVDITEDTFTMDPEDARKKITEKTRAILPVHLFGHPCDMDPLMEIAREHHLFVIEDCAQAHGALYKGKKVGTFGDCGCFSFFPSKNLGCYGDGGAIVLKEKELYEKLLLLRNHGQTGRHELVLVGTNSRLDGIQAAILSAKLKHLDDMNDRRIKCAELFAELIDEANIPVIPPRVRNECRHVYHMLTVKCLEDRDELEKFLKENGVDCEPFYKKPAHKQLPYQRYLRGELPVTERVGEQVLSLPIFPQLQPSEIRYIVKKIKEFYQN